MNVARDLWNHYRQAFPQLLIRAVVGCIAGSGALYGASLWSSDAELKLSAAQRRLSDAQENLRISQNLLRNARAHHDYFISLQRSGFAAAPDLIAWTEQLLSNFRQLPLPSLRFEISPAAIHLLPPAVRQMQTNDQSLNEPLAVGYQAAQVTLTNLHEEEWIRFVEAFENAPKGRGRVERCTARRQTLGLEVTCEIRWWFYPPVR